MIDAKQYPELHAIVDAFMLGGFSRREKVGLLLGVAVCLGTQLTLVARAIGPLGILVEMSCWAVCIAYGFLAGAKGFATYAMRKAVRRDFAVAKAIEVIGGKIQAGETGEADEDCVLLYTALRSGGKVEETKDGIAVEVGELPPERGTLN